MMQTEWDSWKGGGEQSHENKRQSLTCDCRLMNDLYVNLSSHAHADRILHPRFFFTASDFVPKIRHAWFVPGNSFMLTYGFLLLFCSTYCCFPWQHHQQEKQVSKASFSLSRYISHFMMMVSTLLSHSLTLSLTSLSLCITVERTKAI